MHSFLLKSTLVLNSALLFWKSLVSEFLLGISKTLHHSMSAFQVKIVPLLDAHQLLVLFARTLTYSELETFALINFYNMYNYCYYYYLILLVCFVYISLLICIFSSAYL
jgi:hypothetical protein